jgi:hypothetical protein
MIETTPFVSYLHLNSSFSDDIGFVRGKMATVLYFSSIKDAFYQNEIAFNFLEEILSQLNTHTPLSYGHGLSGVGCLLEHLRRQQILDIDVNEMVEEFETHLLKSIEAGLSSDVTLENGLSGYGLYLLSRYSSGILSNESKACLRRILEMVIDQILNATKFSTSLLTDASLWTGISGVYMFLSHASAVGLMTVEHDKPLGDLIFKIIQSITISKPSWHQLPLWHVLLNCRSLLPYSLHAEQLSSEFSSFLEWSSCTSETIHFANAAFYGSLFRYTSIFQNISDCQPVSEKLIKMADRVLNENSLKALFPYSHGHRCINTGLLQGVSGTALALLSIETNDFGWMEILGYKNHHLKIN